MTNTVPVDALSRADAMLSDKKDPIIPLSDVNPEISPAVSNVILKGLEVAKEKRFGTAAEMQKALRMAYSQMQNQMSAETQVFNVDDIHSTVPPAKDPSTPAAPSEMETRTTNGQPEPAEFVEAAPIYDATLAMDAEEVREVVRQADVTTEVFNASDIASPQPVAETPAEVITEPPPSPFDSVKPADEFSEPAATVPLISIDASNVPSASSEPPAPEFFTAPAVEVKNEEISPPVTPAPVATAATAAAAQPAYRPQKKSGSKAFLILGGLGAFFILVLGALGGGWYYYTNYYNVADAKPTPTPTPAATPEATSPTPEPSPSLTPTPDSNSNSNSNNQEVKTVEPTPVPDSTPGIGTRPQQTPVTRETPVKPVRTPGPRATPKPKPTADRTVILQ